MKKVLIVDDSKNARQQIAATLGDAGYQVLEAQDGQDGLDLINENPDLALVVLDINMPRMTGMEMLAALRAAGGSSVPIVMLTTEGRADQVEKARANGARGWLVKPFKAVQLVAAARKLAGES